MKLSEIIKTNDKPDTAILYEAIAPYKKQLLIYYKNMFNCDPVAMVTSVTNATAYIKIVPANEFFEAIQDYLNADNTLSDEDRTAEEETINFNSRLFKEL
jgi:hypothetical protein